MSNDIQIKVTGLEELEKKLLELEGEVAAKSIIGSAFTANKKLVDAARGTLEADGSVDTGLLRDSIARKKVIYANKGVVKVITGVNRNVRGVDSKGRPRVPWRYAHLVEGKTKFMSRAADMAKTDVVNTFIESLKRKVKKYTK